MIERLQKILSARGVASRRRAEELIAAGEVSVNGTVAKLGDCADAERDEICIGGRPLPEAQRRVYLMLNKPRGYVTTAHDERGRPSVCALVEDCGVRVYPVGRLDMDSEGLLLLTNDGDFANRMTHPAQEVEKVYRVLVEPFSEDALEKLREPVMLDGYTIAPPRVALVRTEGGRALLEITIHEGRNRQIRRMCALAGLRVVRLRRIREGNFRLGNLPAGKWRYLTPDEQKEIRKL
ncbi:MAG: rRNA pseudouridine synthase [Firmicutes bacterium]|nr:rRNA pseudouridine synthase [Bacillota bacterium]